MANNNEMTSEQMISALRRYIEKNFNNIQTLAAEYWGISDSYLSEVLSGKKRPNARILDDVGIEHLDKYRWKKKGG
jgi:predicted aldo/keto reductase-like oxidoreductase